MEDVDINYRIIVDDAVKYLNAKVKAIKGPPVKLLGTIQDITPQVLSENALQQKNMELQQLNSNLEEFVFIASHDLKEPIRKIITFSEMITHAEAERLGEKSRSYFERMIGAARRMDKLVQDLLSLSVISKNQSFTECSLQTILSEAIQDLELKITEKRAVINSDKLPTAFVNHSQFRQLFFNLIGNSLKFAAKDIPLVINISSRMLSLREVEQLSLIKHNDYLKITFEDNGIGFENVYAEKIFQMFQRLHGKVDYEGTGIGLAICKKIVENHKGIIYANGAPGKGAIFTVIIPQVVKANGHKQE
jgi:light-regulated signal transduction histidine kinase (bacteriophytochrome)